MASWTDLEVKSLLAIWNDSKIQEELDGAVRNKAVYEKIAQKMKEQGHQRDWKQCRSKVKNLKTKYREVKDHNNKTGNGRKECKFFSELENILGHRPASVPAALLDSGSSSSQNLGDEDTQSSFPEEEVNGNVILSFYIFIFYLNILICRWESSRTQVSRRISTT